MKHAVGWVALGLFVPAAAVAAPLPTASPAPDDGLVRIHSRVLDDARVRPRIDLSAYRAVLIDAPRVDFAKDWLKRINETRGVSRRIGPADSAEIVEYMSAAVRDAVAAAFVSRGYAIAAVPAPGVLRLSPSVSDLFVNAPYVPGPGIDRSFVHREVGEATLSLDVRDAVDGTLFARIVDHDTAEALGPAEQATREANLFWFGSMYRSWAADCANVLRAGASAAASP